MKTANVILMGYGNVGKSFIRLVHEKREFCRRCYGLELKVKAIFEIGGALFSTQVLKLEEILEKRASQLAENPSWKHDLALKSALNKIEPGVLVECTPTNIKTGEPGLSHIIAGLDNGWNIVTANKGPLVVDFRGLLQRANKKGVALKFSGATAASLPTLDVGLYSLAGTEILGIEGILNGTTNYILTRMEQGLQYEEALIEAQSKGIAEADPSLDIEGWDTASKLLIISNAVAGTNFVLSDMKVEGIKNIPTDFILEAIKRNKILKLLGRLYKKENEYRAEVGLDFLDQTHPLAGISGTNKGITFFTDTMDAVTVIGGKSDARGAAAALLKDIINIYK